ncbi:MOSC domain-containing protein [Aeoliella mucimassa]|uniref:6-N-hydroxylaminopurine resistance protein n=1 Tax=Aeoliella mucimassa TaxID=2527972 RepID=A0A518AHH1_9BACT|nr:MOSC domain-containing protein [Aeoliella mucimassa]QDU54176.1 6-N-hydroxylaminopurine resistance protein [Aeoliella mucimassa]
MQLLSVNVGRPRLVQYNGQTISTAIYKEPVTGEVEVDEMGLVPDDQADKRVHGGADKAVYAYTEPSYAWWRTQLSDHPLPPGTFGENLTIDGLTDAQVQIGDQFRIGTVLLEVTQPRQPCSKLGVKMKSPAFIKQFHQAELPGFYLRVLEPGRLAVGQAVERVMQAEHSMNIPDIYRLLHAKSVDRNELQRAAELPALSAAWRSDFEKLLSST